MTDVTIPLIWQCRDLWHNEDPEQKPRDRRYIHFKSFLLSYINDHNKEAPHCVQKLLDDYSGGHSYLSYSSDQMSSKINSEARGRTYRFAFAADVGHHDNDFRVRYFLQELMNRNIPIRWNSTVCNMFCDRDGGETSRNKVFLTQPCSRFEQLFYLSCATLLALARSKCKKRKRNSTAQSSQHSFFQKFLVKTLSKFEGSPPQRVGWAIQKIIRAWDSFARHLGFKGIEHMIIPYLYFDDSHFIFKTISSRSNGFAPSSILNEIKFGLHQTTIEEETFQLAFNFPVSIDSILRQFTTFFLDDVYNIIQFEELYTITTGSDWNLIQRFIGHGRQLSSRFDLFSQSDIDQIISYLKPSSSHSSQPISSPPPQPSPQTSSTPQRISPTSVPSTSNPTSIDSPSHEDVQILRSALNPYCRMYNCSYSDLIDVDNTKSESAESIENQVQLILTDPPFNTRREEGKAYSDYDILRSKDLVHAVELYSDLLREGGHGLIFCSIQQYPKWVKALNEHRQEGAKFTTFKVDNTPLLTVYHPRNYNSIPYAKSTNLQNASGYIVHFKKKGLKFKEEEKMVNYRSFNYVPSHFAAHRNVINNIPRLQRKEGVRIPKADPTKGTRKLRPEQKPIPLLKELICRFSQPNDIVVDLFSGTFSTAIACLQLPNPRCFVGCELDELCFTHSLKHVIRSFSTFLVNNPVHKFSIPAEAFERAKLIAEKSLHSTIDPNWTAPPHLPQFQILPLHILQFIGNQQRDIQFARNCQNIPPHEWSGKYRAYLDLCQPDQLRNHEATHFNLCLAKSTIKHDMAGLGVFALRSFHRGDTVCYFYGTLVYHNLFSRKDSNHLYGGDNLLGVKLSQFAKYSLLIDVEGDHFKCIKEKISNSTACTITPPEFCIARYINDHRYEKGDQDYKEHTDNSLSFQRTQNVAFHIEKPVEHPSELLPYSLATIKATKPINIGDELFISYGMNISIIRKSPSSPSSSLDEEEIQELQEIEKEQKEQQERDKDRQTE